MKNLKELFFIFILCSSLGNAQLATEKQTLLLRTFGFIQGQQNTLNIIKSNFPRQSINANLAELAFNKKYQTAINNIDLEVKKIYGSSFDNYLTDLKNVADEYFKSTKLSENDAIIFVQGVQNKTKGIIRSPFLETILKYQYQENPVNEFLDGNLNTYSVKNYTTSNTIDLEVNIPKSWKELDGVFPSVLKKFRSNYGTGNEIITIIIDKSNYKKPKQLNINNSFSKKELLKVAPVGSKILSSYSEKIDNKLAGIIEYEEVSPTIGSNQKRIVTQYVFIYQNNLLRINCATYGIVSEDLDKRVQKIKPLYLAILKSINLDVLNNILVYKN